MARHALAFILLVVVLLFGCPSLADAQLSLYDDFTGPLIDPGRWFGNEASAGSASPTTEFIRVIANGHLRLAVTQYGRNDTDTGNADGRMSLSVTQDPAGITAMQATVKVTAGEAQGCATNASSRSRARAQVIGAFFNDGTSPNPGGGDRTGDIHAGTQKVADSTLGHVIEAFVVRCTNFSCTTNEPVTPNQQFTTTWQPNQSHTLGVQWDEANHQFIHTVKPLFGPAETLTLPYAVSDTDPAVVPFRRPQSDSTTPNCNGSRLRTRMDAQFDTFKSAR